MKHFLLLSLLLPFISGCVYYDCGYTSNESIRKHRVASVQKVPVTYSVSLVDYWNIQIPANSLWAPDRASMSQKVKEALEKSALFSSVTEVPEKSKGRYHFAFRFNARGSDDGDSIAVGTLSGATLCLIPVWEDAGFDGSVVVYLRGRPVFSKSAAEKQKCFVWLPLLPLGVFANSAVAWHLTENGVVSHLVNGAATYHYEMYCR